MQYTAGVDDLITHTTALLTRTQAGDAEAAAELTPLLYEHLRQLAGSMLREERADHTLQPTALVHEAFLRLVDQRSVTADDRAAFMGLAATMMRRILVDHARAKKRMKRGGGVRRVSMDEGLLADPAGQAEASVDVEAMDAALRKLAQMDERKSRLVELRFFCGVDEVTAAELVGISRATASREWRMARSWLVRELEGMNAP